MPQKEKKSFKEDLNKKIKELSALYEVGKFITSTLHLDEVLAIITKKAANIMNASACSLRLLDKSGHELLLRSSYGFTNKKNEKIKRSLKIGESIAGRVVKNGKPYVINDLRKERRYKYPYCVTQRGLRSLVTVPLVQKDKIIGVLSIYNIKIGKYAPEDAKLLAMFASQAAIAIENAKLFEQAQAGYLNTIKTLSNIIDAKDSQTFGHSERVMEHCMEVANALRLSEEQKEVLKYAGLLHDIGKIGIDVGILRKPSKLTKEEWKIMVMHPIVGSGIVEQIGFLDDLAPIILHHHERYDGKGYPSKLKKERIPLEARILSVVDAYESMVSDRPYRKALSSKKIRQELLQGAGAQFDPNIVNIFLKTLNKKKHKAKKAC
ncbi:MAG: GAF domain-containing protein [Candidatus Omnitrophica bacterium]|nr:GAF domain-containing protein [Candidatus Omnitrophota bacterium]